MKLHEIFTSVKHADFTDEEIAVLKKAAGERFLFQLDTPAIAAYSSHLENEGSVYVDIAKEHSTTQLEKFVYRVAVIRSTYPDEDDDENDNVTKDLEFVTNPVDAEQLIPTLRSVIKRIQDR